MENVSIIYLQRCLTLFMDELCALQTPLAYCFVFSVKEVTAVF